MAKHEGVADRFDSIAKLIADARDWAKDDERLGGSSGFVHLCAIARRDGSILWRNWCHKGLRPLVTGK